jgi:hypothetical protein
MMGNVMERSRRPWAAISPFLPSLQSLPEHAYERLKLVNTLPVDYYSDNSLVRHDWIFLFQTVRISLKIERLIHWSPDVEIYTPIKTLILSSGSCDPGMGLKVFP